jgi:hypothetical protein
MLPPRSATDPIMPSLSIFHAEPFMRPFNLAATILCLPAAACGQRTMPAAQQIALAVLPLPKNFRADATVLGFGADGKLVTLRKGTGTMICLMSDPKLTEFHPACYQNSMEPFMARGRELRGQGVKNVDSARFAEVASGKVPMPTQAATLWAMDGPMSGVNAPAGTVTAAIKLRYSVYMPFATSASTGLPSEPLANGPWLMDAGTPKAHIMFTMTM